MSQNKMINFEDSLDPTDFGLIISKDGELKGLFIPEDKEAPEFIPDSIVRILNDIYGIELGDGETLH